jgi:hypothetical protein
MLIVALLRIVDQPRNSYLTTVHVAGTPGQDSIWTAHRDERRPRRYRIRTRRQQQPGRRW